MPETACGGDAVLALAGRAHPPPPLVIAVEENGTAMRATPAALGLLAGGRVVRARSYAEAIGLVAAHRAGVRLGALGAAAPPIPQLQKMEKEAEGAPAL